MTPSPKPSPSISMIAKEVGFTKTTVSLALRDHPRISAETKRKIKAVAKAQGYTTDPHLTRAFSIIREGRSPTHNVIGYLDTSSRSDDPGSHFPNCVKRNLIEYAEIKGFSVSSLCIDDEIRSHQKAKRIIESRNIKYLLVPAPAIIDDLPFDWENLSTIVLSAKCLEKRFNRVTTSNYQAMSLTMKHIKEKGYRKPGFITRNNTDDIQGSECSIAFNGLCKHLGFDDNTPILSTQYPTPLSTYEKWYWKHKPDVIIQSSLNGIYGEGLMQYSEILNRFTIPLPRQTGRCSLNANPKFEPVSGVRRNAQEIGRSAIELMISMIEHNISGVPEHPKSLTIMSDWYEGKTLPKISTTP